MKSRSLIMLAIVAFTALARLSAEERPENQSKKVVGSVFGKAVTAADIGMTGPVDPAVKFDARNTAEWKLMSRIMITFGGPVMERFVKQQKIEATADEIEAFGKQSRKSSERNLNEMEARLAKVNADLKAPGLRDEDKAKLEKEQKKFNTITGALRRNAAAAAPRDLARAFIVAWKTERALERVYGGRVIFQQAGLEALDARRRLFEQAEKNGDIKFDDAGVRHMFYYYSNMRHSVVDAKGLEHPWFLEDGS